MLRIICPLLVLCALALPAQGRTLTARIGKVVTPVATLEQVQVRLEWPAQAAQGQLSLRAQRASAPDLGYRFRDLSWTCPLRRSGKGGWQCDGTVRGGGKPMRLALRFDAATTEASLAQGAARFALQRNAATPDLTRLHLTQVPAAWAQAFAAQAWPSGQFTSGRLDGRLDVRAPTNKPLQVEGNLRIAGLGLETPDAAIAAENLGATLHIDYRKLPAASLLAIEGDLLGGEFLAGNTYVALPATPVRIGIDAIGREGQGWELPRIAWNDGAALQGEGSAALTAAGGLDRLQMRASSRALPQLRDRYLSGWLGVFGIGDVALRGGIDMELAMAGGKLTRANATLHALDVSDPRQRFGFTGLEGNVRFSAGEQVYSLLRWRSSQLYGLDVGAASLPMRSGDGVLAFENAVAVLAMGGTLRFENLTLRPPADGAGLDVRFGLAVDAVDVAQIAKALGLPEFQGKLTGRIPNAHYAGERLDFDGGLSVDVFGGSVRISALSMERPFGVAPSLSADVAIDNLDLLSLTGVFDFGSITGKLDGDIHGLRLVDWTAVAFDSDLRTDRTRGVRQRISQRAVQNISSVGDASFVSSLQAQLIGLFDDFGYSRIRIGCKLENEVCAMHGLSDTPHSDSAGFTIVQGSGLPRLRVVGYNRRVDWPTLVERLAAVGQGDATPVVE